MLLHRVVGKRNHRPVRRKKERNLNQRLFGNNYVTADMKIINAYFSNLPFFDDDNLNLLSIKLLPNMHSKIKEFNYEYY